MKIVSKCFFLTSLLSACICPYLIFNANKLFLCQVFKRNGVKPEIEDSFVNSFDL